MANFGHIPYGQSIVGGLFFNISNLNGCDAPRRHHMKAEEELNTPKIFLVKRNRKCSYVTQTRNVEA